MIQNKIIMAIWMSSMSEWRTSHAHKHNKGGHSLIILQLMWSCFAPYFTIMKSASFAMQRHALQCLGCERRSRVQPRSQIPLNACGVCSDEMTFIKCKATPIPWYGINFNLRCLGKYRLNLYQYRRLEWSISAMTCFTKSYSKLHINSDWWTPLPNGIETFIAEDQLHGLRSSRQTNNLLVHYHSWSSGRHVPCHCAHIHVVTRPYRAKTDENNRMMMFYRTSNKQL